MNTKLLNDELRTELKTSVNNVLNDLPKEEYENLLKDLLRDSANDKKNKPVKYLDNLPEDPVIDGQSWACLSFIDSKTTKDSKYYALKVRGVYSDELTAKKQASAFRDMDPYFDVYVAPVGKWLPWNPEPDTIEEEIYSEPELNRLMKNYKDNQRKSKEEFEQRKKELVESNLLEESKRIQKSEQRLKQKLNRQLIDTDDHETIDTRQEVNDIVNQLNEKIKQLDKERKAMLNNNKSPQEIERKEVTEDDLRNTLKQLATK